MDEFAPIFKAFNTALIFMTVMALVVLVLLIIIIVRLVKVSKAKRKDGKPVSRGLKAATIVCYVILALLLTSPFWIDFTPIMDKLEEIV